MKTVKRMDLIDSSLINYNRVSDEQAEKLVDNEGWKYCPKQEWKTKIRDFYKKENK